MVQLALVLADDQEEDHVLAATAWTVGQIGRHTPEHAKAVAVANIFPKLLSVSAAPCICTSLIFVSRSSRNRTISKNDIEISLTMGKQSNIHIIAKISFGDRRQITYR